MTARSKRGAKRIGALAVVVALSLVGCGGGGGEAGKPHAADDPGPVHVHGLGVNPADGALFVATHTGLFRVGAGESRATRVGDSAQDTMGFTVVGPNRFLGSGHPDPRDIGEDGLPPLLGLIESRDAGETWRPVSLRGRADFHVLRFVRNRIYGFDSTTNRIMMSTDGGKSWRRHPAPGALIDLAVDPANADHLLATSPGGAYRSTDGGRRWSRIGTAVGLLAWPARTRLYLVDPAGRVFVSRGAGLRRVGDIGGKPAALLAPSGRELYVALHDGTIKRSRDGGASWTVRSTP